MINSSIHDIVLRMKKTCRNEYYKFYSKFWACTVKKTSSALSGILSPTLFCTCNSIPGNRQTLDVCCVIHDKGFPRPVTVSVDYGVARTVEAVDTFSIYFSTNRYICWYLYIYNALFILIDWIINRLFEQCTFVSSNIDPGMLGETYRYAIMKQEWIMI